MMTKILLVDDEQEFVSTLAERLTIRGFDADWAVDGKNAMKLLETKTYDVAILDVKLPGMGGIELKREMEKISPNMNFIFMTGHGSENDFRAGEAETGEGYYLPKPIKIDILIEKINEQINR